jgi:hypothetical protein
VDLTFRSFMTAATKFGPWAALAIALVVVLVFRFDTKLDAQSAQIVQLMAAQDRQVRLLEIMCSAVVSTETERRACELAAR